MFEGIRKLPDDIVAQLYLNSDFAGGEFFFEDWEGKREEIQPSCGKVVMFSSGQENMHGVRGVTEGRRCMLRTWLTKDQTKGKTQQSLLEDTPLASTGIADRDGAAGTDERRAQARSDL